jgi:hypothetical protein
MTIYPDDLHLRVQRWRVSAIIWTWMAGPWRRSHGAPHVETRSPKYDRFCYADALAQSPPLSQVLKRAEPVYHAQDYQLGSVRILIRVKHLPVVA